MTSLDIFSVPETDYSLQGFRIVPYHKLSSSITPMKFAARALDNYTDLNCSFFIIDLRLYSSSQHCGRYQCFLRCQQNQIRLCRQQPGPHHLQADQPAVQWGLDERTDRHLCLLSLFPDPAQLQPRRWGDVAAASRLGQFLEHDAYAGGDDDISTTAGWAHNNSNLLKTLTTPFRSNNVVRLIMRPYLPTFHTGKVMVPGVEMNFGTVLQ